MPLDGTRFEDIERKEAEKYAKNHKNQVKRTRRKNDGKKN